MQINVESYGPDLFSKSTLRIMHGNFKVAKRVIRFQANVDWPKVDVEISSPDADLRGVDLRALLDAVTQWVQKNGNL